MHAEQSCSHSQNVSRHGAASVPADRSRSPSMPHLPCIDSSCGSVQDDDMSGRDVWSQEEVLLCVFASDERARLLRRILHQMSACAEADVGCRVMWSRLKFELFIIR
jgi:hypothetical protein